MAAQIEWKAAVSKQKKEPEKREIEISSIFFEIAVSLASSKLERSMTIEAKMCLK